MTQKLSYHSGSKIIPDSIDVNSPQYKRFYRSLEVQEIKQSQKTFS
ncbi:MAG: hypothetical protein AABX16_05515 [Nanoarchaeota archaeon]